MRQTVLIVGDVMVDHYIYGVSHRLSPEAPVPVVEVENEDSVLGGAANVAANVAALGGRAILIGLTGDDKEARTLHRLARQAGIECLFETNIDRRTTQKTRVVSGRQQIVRFDREDVTPPDDATLRRVLYQIDSVRSSIDAVILSDYGKGMFLREGNFNKAIYGNAVVIVDPKTPRYWSYCPPGCVLKPNRQEAEAEWGERIRSDTDALRIAEALRQRVRANATYITFGERGGVLAAADNEPVMVPTSSVAVFDPTGAGDVVAAALAVGLGEGMSVLQAVQFANSVAGVAVAQPGTSVVRVRPAQEVRGS